MVSTSTKITKITRVQSMPLSSAGAFSLSLERQLHLLVFHGPRADVVTLVEGAPLVLGRGAEADLCFDHPGLSRRHARLEYIDDGLWVEDLGSTNGTLVNGARVSRQRVASTDSLVIGGLIVVQHPPSRTSGLLPGLMSHDELLSRLDHEIVRHRFFDRPLGLLLVRTASREADHPGRWVSELRKVLRPVDEVALYSRDSIEILLPECAEEELTRMARAINAARPVPEPALLCAGALFPASGTSPEAMLEAAHAALMQTSAKRPLVLAQDAARRDGNGGQAREGQTRKRQASGDVVVRSSAMERVFKLARRMARNDIPVLICGETGTGKEVVARTIQQGGPRKAGPYLTVNCAAVPDQLIESVMFGHEKGAFTGADQARDGVFVEADGGTVLLDEIGELSAKAQASLLRVLETRRLNRVGSTTERKVDVRILAATHRNLEAMCEAGDFRWDLLYRINTMKITLPPLRDRPEEVEPLALRFLEAAGAERVRGIASEAMELLRAHAWPGNVRELRNVILRGALLAEGAEITVMDLPERLVGQLSLPEEAPLPEQPHAREAADPSPLASPSSPGKLGLDDLLTLLDGGEELDFKGRVQQLEARIIERGLTACRWNRTKTAKRLRIPLRTLTHKIRTLGLDAED